MSLEPLTARSRHLAAAFRRLKAEEAVAGVYRRPATTVMPQMTRLVPLPAIFSNHDALFLPEPSIELETRHLEPPLLEAPAFVNR